MKWFGTLCTLGVFGLVLSGASATADEQKVPLDQVPKAVTDAFKAKFPHATIKNAIKETEDGQVTYEIESIDAGGLSIDAVLKPDGGFVAVEKQIKPSELPAAVAPAVQGKYPNAVIQKAESVESAGEPATFEVVVKKADGKVSTLIFDHDGKFVEEEK